VPGWDALVEAAGARWTLIDAASASFQGAIGVVRRLGLVHEATLPRRELLGGALRDQMIWSVYRDGYPGTPGAALARGVTATDALGQALLGPG
jgi:hypothetical protein